MNLIKAYAIIAVVASHTLNGGIVFPLDNWIQPYFYFMPIFVFVSGYFYRKETDNSSVIKYLGQKAKIMLLPYFLWNVVYGILNAILREIGVVHYGSAINLKSLFITPWITGHQFAFMIPAWFLLSLFIISVVIFILRKILCKLHILNEELLLIFCFGVSIITIYLAESGHNQNWELCFAKAGFMLPYFQMGFVYKKYEKLINKRKGITLSILFVLLYICYVLGDGNERAQVVFANFVGNPFLISALVVIEILIVSTICESLVPAFDNNKIVQYIGDNTFSIMMHHAVVIFLINFALYILSKFIDIASFNVEKFQSTIWYCYPWRDDRIYLIYVVLGIAVPLVLKKVTDKIVMNLYEKQKIE
ncbi:MAG: acyltransferase [Clostridia bacterium]|nr:acyltransferase [Clostridia bacterium]